MKTNLLIVPALLAAVVSCDKESPVSSFSNRADMPVCFDASTAGHQTKAYAEAGLSSLQSGGFKVAAVASGAADSFFNETATWESSSACYKTAGSYYQPATGKTAYYALYPAEKTISVSGGSASFACTLDVKEDILAAYTLQEKTDKPVSLTFGHILSQAAVRVKGGDPSFIFKVESVRLSGKGAGEYAFASNSWISASQEKDAVYFSGEQQVSTTDFTSFDVDNLAFIPKGDGADGKDAVKVTVAYKVYKGSTLVSDFTGANARSATASLEQGKRCVVNCILPTGNITDMTFTLTVTPWGDAVTQEKTL